MKMRKIMFSVLLAAFSLPGMLSGTVRANPGGPVPQFKQSSYAGEARTVF